MWWCLASTTGTELGTRVYAIAKGWLNSSNRTGYLSVIASSKHTRNFLRVLRANVSRGTVVPLKKGVSEFKLVSCT